MPGRALAFVFAILAAASVPVVAGTASVERIPSDEASATATISRVITATVIKAYRKNGPPARRDAFAKQHGCVRARFRIESDLAARLRYGVFAQPHTFAAWIRFSNGAGVPRDDHVGDFRGMAIKLMGVPGPKLLSSEASAQTQDFVLMNFPVFFIRNAAEFAQFVQADAANRSKAFFATHPVAARIRTAIVAQRVENVLDVRYFSTTPYRLGPHYVKYSVQPVTCGQSRRVAQAGGSRSHSQNYLRERMAAQLASANACFEFMVQLQTDPATMPIEDPTVEWKETQAPFIDVARIVIPRQRFDSAAQQNFCENLSYTPWHSLAAHRPVGGINRARRTVYEAISRLRHGLNNAAPVEPSGNEHFEP